MKITIKLLTLTLLLFSLIFNSCKKDDDDPKPVDPCANITCLNGGFCINGSCSCPQGYNGPACENQITPTKIRITKITVTKFPATTSSGGGWDVSNGPDIFVNIYKGSSLIWEEPAYYQNANPTLDYDFFPSPYVDLNSPNDQYTIQLYDYDDIDPNDFMGGIYFVPYSSFGGFPSVLTIDGGGTVAFKIHVTYLW